MTKDADVRQQHCLLKMNGNIFGATHDISALEWDDATASMLIHATGDDPILMLPQVQFESASNYVLELAGEGPDNVWQLYYLTEPEQIHSGDRVLTFSLDDNGQAKVLLPAGLPPQALRLDVGSQPGQIHLNKLVVYEESNSGKLRQAKDGIIYHRCNGMDADSWSQILGLSVTHPVIGDMHFPGFPPADIQDGMVGSHGKHAIEEIALFYHALAQTADGLSWNLCHDNKALDFGCGFGRVTRFFLKDIAYGNLYGADTTQAFIDICKSTFPASAMPAENFIRNEALGSLPFTSSSLDLITAYSVFSHLSEEAANCWLDEFCRILKPGGLLALTIRQKSYIQMCQRLAKQHSDNYYTNLQAQCFGLDEIVLKRFEDGEFIWFPNGGGDVLANTFYGDTVIPDGYIYKNWTDRYLVRALFDEPSRCAQSFLLLQKK